MFGKDLYYLSILGTPSEKNPWMLQFGGHHLALNITIAGERGILTPTLTGAQPALYTLNGKTIRPLGEESLTVSGSPAIEHRFRGSVGAQDWSGFVVFIPRNTRLYTIFGMTAAQSELVQIQENVIARAISSLQFTDP